MARIGKKNILSEFHNVKMIASERFQLVDMYVIKSVNRGKSQSQQISVNLQKCLLHEGIYTGVVT